MIRAAAEDASTRPISDTAIHHAVVVVRDLKASLHFYRDGLGLEELQDRRVEGDWPGLFDGPSRSLRAIFSATRAFRTITPAFWSSTYSTVMSRPGLRPRRPGPGSS